MSPRIKTVSRADLERRRREVLERLGLTRADFGRIVDTRTLSGDEWDAREELEEIEFLLGDPPVDA